MAETTTSFWSKFRASSYAQTRNNLVLEAIPVITFFTMGMGGVMNPQYTADSAGYEGTLTKEGKSQTRAVYGGFGLFMAGLLYFTRDTELEIGAKVSVTAAMLGMATGRCISAVIDKEIHSKAVTLIISEILLSAILLRGCATYNAR